MTVHHIAPEHLDALAQSEHVIKWLQGEMARWQAALLFVSQQNQQEEAKLRAFVSQNYNVRGDFTLDTKAATITTPDNLESPDADRAE